MKALKDLFFSLIFPFVPKRLLSRATGILMRLPLPKPLAALVIPLFARLFGIRAEDSEMPTAHYRSLDGFFTRRLKAGLRPISGPMVHPVDGQLTEQGLIHDGNLLQAKGWTYSLGELLGDENLAKTYQGGFFYTYYLCPADYHRVHAPVLGQLISARHIPGLLWPVNNWSVHHVRRLFCLNERVVMNFQAPRGPWSLVMVGATNVGHMTIAHDPSIITNRWMWHAPTDRHYSPPVQIHAGDELGTFHLGSTVICVFSRGFGCSSVGSGAVKMGQQLLGSV